MGEVLNQRPRPFHPRHHRLHHRRRHHRLHHLHRHRRRRHRVNPSQISWTSHSCYYRHPMRGV